MADHIDYIAGFAEYVEQLKGLEEKKINTYYPPDDAAAQMRIQVEKIYAMCTLIAPTDRLVSSADVKFASEEAIKDAVELIGTLGEIRRLAAENMEYKGWIGMAEDTIFDKIGSAFHHAIDILHHRI